MQLQGVRRTSPDSQSLPGGLGSVSLISVWATKHGGGCLALCCHHGLADTFPEQCEFTDPLLARQALCSASVPVRALHLAPRSHPESGTAKAPADPQEGTHIARPGPSSSPRTVILLGLLPSPPLTQPQGWPLLVSPQGPALCAHPLEWQWVESSPSLFALRRMPVHGELDANTDRSRLFA